MFKNLFYAFGSFNMSRFPQFSVQVCSGEHGEAALAFLAFPSFLCLLFKMVPAKLPKFGPRIFVFPWKQTKTSDPQIFFFFSPTCEIW